MAAINVSGSVKIAIVIPKFPVIALITVSPPIPASTADMATCVIT